MTHDPSTARRVLRAAVRAWTIALSVSLSHAGTVGATESPRAETIERMQSFARQVLRLGEHHASTTEIHRAAGAHGLGAAKDAWGRPFLFGFAVILRSAGPDQRWDMAAEASSDDLRSIVWCMDERGRWEEASVERFRTLECAVEKDSKLVRLFGHGFLVPAERDSWTSATIEATIEKVIRRGREEDAFPTSASGVDADFVIPRDCWGMEMRMSFAVVVRSFGADEAKGGVGMAADMCGVYRCVGEDGGWLGSGTLDVVWSPDAEAGGATVTGSVSDRSGVPVEGMRIQLRGSREPAFGDVRFEREVWTDGDGSFRIEGIPRHASDLTLFVDEGARYHSVCHQRFQPVAGSARRFEFVEGPDGSWTVAPPQ